MELRWFNGKLQYREGVTHDSPWIDVPTVSEEVKEYPCEYPAEVCVCNPKRPGCKCAFCDGGLDYSKPKATKEVWCEHILFSEKYNCWETVNYEVNNYTTKIRVSVSHWNQCPICLTPRPEKVEKKELPLKWCLDNYRGGTLDYEAVRMCNEIIDYLKLKDLK